MDKGCTTFLIAVGNGYRGSRADWILAFFSGLDELLSITVLFLSMISGLIFGAV
jgi:hypothetical protein